MDYRRPERVEPLAAQYVLGTLRGRARARFARLVQIDPAVAAEVQAWEARLLPLLESLPPVQPPPGVWPAILERIQGRGTASAGGFWASLRLWRALAATGFIAAFALAVALLNPRPDVTQAYVAVLAAQDGRAVLIATAEASGRVMTLKPLAPQNIPADRSLELWALPAAGHPRPLGLIDPAAVVRLTLPEAEQGRLASIPTLAVSLEPRGGSTTGLPTGPVLFTGALQAL